MKPRSAMILLGAALVSIGGGRQFTAPREAQNLHTAPGGPSEPAAAINAGAVLEAIVGPESRPQGLVRLSMTSLLTDADAQIQAAPRLEGEHPRDLARLRLLRGRRHDVRFTVDLEPGVDNQIQFIARTRTPDGAEQIQSIYLEVPLNPDTQPELVGDYLVYQGSVSPAGGVR